MELEALNSSSEPEEAPRSGDAGRRIFAAVLALGVGVAMVFVVFGIQSDTKDVSVEAHMESITMLVDKGEKNACTFHKDKFFKCEKKAYKIHHGYAKDPSNCKNKCERDRRCTSWNTADGCEICKVTGTEEMDGSSGGTCKRLCRTYEGGCDEADDCVCPDKAPKCALQNGDVKGSDVKEEKDTTVEKCQELCESNEDCHCFAFDPSRSNTCWLKGEGCHTGKGWSESGDMTSGVGCQG